MLKYYWLMNMRIKDKNIEVIDAVNFANYQDMLFKRRENNMLLSDYQINVLKSNGINYSIYANLRELLFKINEVLSNNYQEDLDLVASQISEILYYTETKK